MPSTHWWRRPARAPDRRWSRSRYVTSAAPSPPHPPGAGALAEIDAPFLWFGVGIAPGPDAREGVDRFIDGLAGALAPWDAGRGYWNFAERKVDPATLVGAEVYGRLQEILRRVDPDGRFLANHVIATGDA